LDPDIASNGKRLDLHQDYNKNLSQEMVEYLGSEEFFSVKKLAKIAPSRLLFMPSKQVLRKLILRATQIVDVIGEINPWET